MKKIIALVLSLAMLFCLVCCKTAAGEGTTETDIRYYKDEIAKLQNHLAENDEKMDSLKEKVKDLESENRSLQKSKEYLNENQKYIDYCNSLKENSYYFTATVPIFDEATGKYKPLDLPKYKEGSIKLNPRLSYAEELFTIKYRYSYYYSQLPYTNALKVVRGEDFVEAPFVINFADKMDELDCLKGEPPTHCLIQWISAYAVSKEEMKQIVDLLSDLESEAYAGYGETDHIDFTTEMYEIVNVDILYTFNQDIINEYYRRA